MLLLRRGMRLSVQPVEQAEYERIVAMSREPAPVLPEKPAAKKPPTKKKPAKKKRAPTKRKAKPKKRR